MTDQTPTIYCANHPDVPTTLHCNRCEKPICPKCAVLTPTGYRCKECVRGQQKIFETAEWYDYPVAMITVGLLSFLGSLAVNLIGFFLIVFFVAPVIGTVIGEIARYVTRRRRSKRLFRLIAVAAACGALPILLVAITRLLLGGMGGLVLLITPAIYMVMVPPAVYYRLAGINL